jgi:hypothetical protein
MSLLTITFGGRRRDPMMAVQDMKPASVCPNDDRLNPLALPHAASIILDDG